jgi:hypothetical protein
MNCPYCQESLPENSRFCSACGMNLPGTGEGTVAVCDTSSPGDHGGRSFSNILISAATLILGLISGIMFFVAAENLAAAGNEMLALESISGTSLAEAYYQQVGNAVISLALFLKALGIGFIAFAAGIFGLISKQNR